MAEVSRSIVTKFRAQELSNIAIAFCRAGHGSVLSRNRRETDPLEPAVMFLKELARECSTRVNEFQPQHLANTAWAYAKMGLLSHPDSTSLLQAISTRVVSCQIVTHSDFKETPKEQTKTIFIQNFVRLKNSIFVYFAI